jgi:hypothetical protein
MSEKINLRMLDPKPLPTSEPFVGSTQSTLVHEDDVDLTKKLEEEEQRVTAEERPMGGWIGGAIGATLSALVLAIVAAAFGVWINWFCIGIGFAVAFGVRRLGNGSSRRFGVIGATCAFIGCVVAYHLAWCIVLAHEEGVSVLDFVSEVESWSSFMIDILGPRDFAIYVAAMAAGYKFSYTNVSDQY